MAEVQLDVRKSPDNRDGKHVHQEEEQLGDGKNDSRTEGKKGVPGIEVEVIRTKSAEAMEEMKRIEERVKKLRTNAWFTLGLWQKPRLRRDWDNVDEPEKYTVNSLSLFFDSMFSFTISNLGFEVRDPENQDIDGVLNWWKRFGVIFSLWMITTDFSARFDNDDIPFKIFWGIWGIGSLSMMIHSTGGPGSRNAPTFAYSVGYLYGLLALQYFRHGFWLKRCRLFCLLEGLVCSFLFVIACIAGGTSDSFTREGLLVLLAFGYPLAGVIASLGVEIQRLLFHFGEPPEEALAKLSVPIYVPYLIKRYSAFPGMVLGQITLAIALNPDIGFGDTQGLYRALSVGFVLLVLMKFFLFDVNYVDEKDHAMNRGESSRLVFQLIFPLAVGGQALLGTGIALLVRISGKFSVPVDGNFAFWLTCSCFALFLALRVVITKLSAVPYTQILRASGAEKEANILNDVASYQSLFQLATAVVIIFLPNGFDHDQAGALNLLITLTFLLLFLVILNLSDERLILSSSYMTKAREIIKIAEDDTMSLAILSLFYAEKRKKGFGLKSEGADTV